MEKEYQEAKKKWIATSKFDSRTMGLLKIEFEGAGIIALCPKSYICINVKGEVEKMSCKGIQKSKAREKAKQEMYLNLIHGARPMTAENQGFIFNQSVYAMCEYIQRKQAFQAVFIKRKVSHDYSFSTCLDL